MSQPRVETRSRLILQASRTHRVPRHSTLAAGVRSTFDSLAWAVRDIRERRRIKRLIGEVGESPVMTSLADDGLVRIEGRVELLSFSAAPDGSPAAAYLVRETRDERCSCDPACDAVLRVVTTTTDAVSFAVRDAAGVALVEGPRIRLRDFKGNAPDPFEAGRLIAREGDSVTVIGNARRTPVSDVRFKSFGGFRAARDPLVFSGSAEEPTLVFVAS